ncbi:MAG: hypothetical protein NZZ41_06965, partial [Candidatus Dojkabacteria bacterium]|nr:hypothetical protein [Candidatus Dojkabacteria bacterium]
MRIVTKRYSDDVKSEIRQLKTEVTEAKTVLKNIVELCARYFEDPNFQLVKQISSRFDRLRGESLDIKDLYEELLMIDSEFQARLISANKLNKNLLFYYTLSVVYLSLPLIFAFSQEEMGE